MEGNLQRWCGFFTRWRQFKYILHEGILHEYNIKTNEELGAIHLAVCTIEVVPKKSLQFKIDNGVSIVFLKTKNIKENVDWVNALNESKGEVLNKEEDEENTDTKMISENNEKLNEVLATNIFNKFDPLYQKIGKVWSTQAQFEEVMSIIEPELERTATMRENKDKILQLTNEMKESVADILKDLEGARNEFAKAIVKFSENDDPFDIENSDEEDLKSVASLRSVRINPKEQYKEEKVEEVKYEIKEEEKVEESLMVHRKFNPKEFTDTMPVRQQLEGVKDHTKKFSIWGLIRDNIGQDLTRVTLPIILNEPCTMLQKFCEMMENAQILERAAEADDSAMRAALVLVFNAAKYSSIQFRTLKPFNPILGETYEYSCPDFRFLAEQVSHHPPITACHTYGKGYEFWDNSQMKSKFWGKSLEFIPESNFYCVFGDEHYVCKKPSTVANNLIFGTLYLDCGGASVCHCPQTGVKGELKFKSKGIWNRTLGQVEGYVSDSAGNKLLRIDGLWTEKISITNLETEEETVVWEIDEKPDNFEDQHSFSKFCINLNNLTPKLEGEIAPTDSRFRTDLREFERGDIDKGAEEKHRLEEKQRAARKDRKDNGETWSPLWFEEVIEEETGDKFFKINDKYWQKKQEGDWSECPDLF